MPTISKKINAIALTFLFSILAACGGGGSSSTNAPVVSPQPTPPVAQAEVLFAADFTNGAIARFSVQNPAPGTAPVGQVITGLSGVTNLSYDAAHDRLFTNIFTGYAVFEKASSMSAGATPSRKVTPAGLSLFVNAMFYDKVHDVVYLGGSVNATSGYIAVFEKASTLNGSITPNRVIKVDQGTLAFTIDLKRGILYTTTTIGGGVIAYDNITTANGTLPFGRRIGVGSGSGLAIDELNDRLYMADVFDGIYVFGQASSPSAKQVALIKFGTPWSNTRSVTLDAANDRLYIGAYENAYILNGVSSLSGSSTSSLAAAMHSPGSSVSAFAFP